MLIERDVDIINGASKANSALLHTGFDSIPGSLEAGCVRDGYARYRLIHDRLGLPLLETGATLLAWSEADLAALPHIIEQARANGVTDTRGISADEVLVREPHLARDIRGGIIVPGEAVIDPWSAPLAYALQGLVNGGTILRGSEVQDGSLADGVWTLKTTSTAIRAGVVINCAGNFGDLVEAISHPPRFEIRPRNGQFVVLDKTASRLAHSICCPYRMSRPKAS